MQLLIPHYVLPQHNFYFKLKVLAEGVFDNTAWIAQAPVVLKLKVLAEGALDTAALISQAPQGPG